MEYLCSVFANKKKRYSQRNSYIPIPIAVVFRLVFPLELSCIYDVSSKVIALCGHELCVRQPEWDISVSGCLI